MLVNSRIYRLNLVLELIILFIFSGLCGANEEKKGTYPPRLSRADSFLGVHFDFHAGSDCTKVGENVDDAMVEYIIDQVKPDYVQCDCKGHAGFSSYPTKVGTPAPGFVVDPLKVWRRVTARRGVGLYMHYSGVLDSEAVKKHPEWACVNSDGNPDSRATSVFGPYVDQLLIPQLKELRDEYKVDGIWIDGDCWALKRDYSQKALDAFRNKTGIDKAPKSSSDANWYEFSQFTRRSFQAYLDHYVTELHKHDKDFQIASNWSYSSFMPEPVNVDVDFISGDFTSEDSVRTARFEGRCMVHQKKPWDLMAWSFTWDSIYSTKTAVQLKQEAAIVLGLGGGFQVYFPQKRDGSIRKWQIPIMAEVADFCRQRQIVCHKAKSVPQIGLIYSTYSRYRQTDSLFNHSGSDIIALKGLLNCLLDGQNVVDIVSEHHLNDRIHEYPVLIYPEWHHVDPEFKVTLMDYVKNGGNLLVVGPRACKLFKNELGIEFVGVPYKTVYFLASHNHIAGINSSMQKVRMKDGTMPFGKVFIDNDFTKSNDIPGSIRKVDKGKIAGIFLELGEQYFNSSTAVNRDFLDDMVNELLLEPIVKVSGSHNVDVNVNRINGKLAVNLINTAGPHQDPAIAVFDEIPPVGPLSITVKYHKKPEKVTLYPGSKNIDYNFKDKNIYIELPSLEIHKVIVVE